VKLIEAKEEAGGFIAVFNWIKGVCPSRMYQESSKEFINLSLETKLKIFEHILDFHLHVAEQGYVAIDFYDGSIMYDIENDKAIVCDIDCYEKTPYKNSMGRLWGSSRFMSPEEYICGADIDEITNVYTMGATAFLLFGNEKLKTEEGWKLNKELYTIAKRAVSNDRNLRHQSLLEFNKEWKEEVPL